MEEGMRYGMILDIWVWKARMWSFGFYIDTGTPSPYVSFRFGTGVWYCNLPKRFGAGHGN